MRRVVVDTNVLISFFYQRNESQRSAAKELLLSAAAGDVVIVLPQFVLFEMVHVFRNYYGVPISDVTAIIRDVLAYPGVVLLTEYPWNDVLDQWHDSMPSIADAAIVAIAVANRYDAVATFDAKLEKKIKSTGIAAYW